MFACNLCKAVFEEPEYREYLVGEFWGVPVYESEDRCPCCNGDDIYEIDWENEDADDAGDFEDDEYEGNDGI